MKGGHYYYYYYNYFYPCYYYYYYYFYPYYYYYYYYFLKPVSPADSWVVRSCQVKGSKPGLEQSTQLEKSGQAWGAHMGLAPSANKKD